MAESGTSVRDGLRADQFAYVDSRGGRHLPIHDPAHIRDAIARWDRTDFESRYAKEGARRRIVMAALSHGIHVAEGGAIARPVR